MKHRFKLSDALNSGAAEEKHNDDRSGGSHKPRGLRLRNRGGHHGNGRKELSRQHQALAFEWAYSIADCSPPDRGTISPDLSDNVSKTAAISSPACGPSPT